MSKSKYTRIILVTLLLIVIAAVAARFLLRKTDPLPGLTYGNGRLEATEADIATKVAGRLAKVLVREGDHLKANQIAAQLDAEDLAAQLRAAESAVQQARQNVASASSQQKLAKVTLDRTRDLIKKGFISASRLDSDTTNLQTTNAALGAARSKVKQAEAQAEALRVNVKDTSLRAPIDGRVLYRLAEPGEVLAAGGKVITLLDLTDVYMSIYLPAADAGKVALNTPAKILLDALPRQPIPARVIFVAPRSQFTPKEVETRNEREKLMFRIKVKVDPEWINQHADLAKPGMPGIAYVQTAPDVVWPATLPLR